MAKLPEAVNGGMVTSKDPSMLQPGELAYAEMCIYTQDNDHLCRMPGVTTLDQLDVTSSVVGLTSCRFEDGTNKLMAMASGLEVIITPNPDPLLPPITATNTLDTYYWTADAEVNNPTFATAYGPITLGEHLVTVQYDNRHYLFNGNNENLVYLKDGSFRPHGLLAATSPELEFYKFSNQLANGDQYYQVPFSSSATGLYEYWYTEVVRFSDGQELESAFDGVPLTINMQSTAHAPVLKLGTQPKNYRCYSQFGAELFYRVYRSEVKPSETSQLYPIGKKIQDVQWLNSNKEPLSSVYFADSSTSLAAPVIPATPGFMVYRNHSWDGPNNPGGVATTVVATASNINSSLLTALNTAGESIKIYFKPGTTNWHDAVAANVTSGQFAGLTGPNLFLMSLRNFNIPPVSGNVVGIQVKVAAESNISEVADIYVMPCMFEGSAAFTDGKYGVPFPANVDLQPKDIPATVLGGAIKPALRGGVLSSYQKFATAPAWTGDLNFHAKTTPTASFQTTGAPGGAGGSYKNVFMHGTVVNRQTAVPSLTIFNSFVPSNEFVEKQEVLTTNTPLTFGYGGPRGPANGLFLTNPYSWPLSTFGDPYFGIQVAVKFRSTAARDSWVVIHGITMQIMYTGTSSKVSQANKFYDAVSLEIAGTQVPFGANKAAPAASTGAIFDGSLVINSKNEPNKLYYSVPGYPDYFPTDVYWFELPGVHNDRITYIGTINGRLVVGTRGNLWRINYLPSQDDASFQRGQAIDLISDSVGIVNPASACTFTNANGQLELAFVDANGVYSTDGYSVRKLSQDLLWVGNNGVVATSMAANNNIYTAIRGLVNDPRTQTLRLLTSSRTFIGSYAAIHAKQGGGLKWTTSKAYSYASVGAQDYVAFPNCIHSLRRANGTWLVTYGMDMARTMGGAERNVAGIGGTVLREDSSDTTTFSQPFAIPNQDFPYIKTRAISPNGPGSELSVDGLCLHGFKQTTLGGAPTSLGCSVTADMSFTNAPPSTSSAALPSVQGAKANYAGIDGVNGEEVQFTIQMSDRNMFELHGIIMDASDFGEVDTSA
jgi:hypothetical protein